MNHRSQGPSRQGERSIAPRHANAKVFFTRGKALRDRFSTARFPGARCRCTSGFQKNLRISGFRKNGFLQLVEYIVCVFGGTFATRRVVSVFLLVGESYIIHRRENERRVGVGWWIQPP